MTEAQAIQRLHESLPREASFTLSFRRSIHSRLDAESLRTEPVRLTSAEDWAVTISHGSYLNSSFHANLADAIDRALTHHAQRQTVDTKPPKLVAPSGAGIETIPARQTG